MGLGAKRTRMSLGMYGHVLFQPRPPPMLIGAHVSPAGGPAKAGCARRGARRAQHPDLQPEPARLEADGLRPRAGRGVPRGAGGGPRRRAADPRRVSAERGQRGPGDPREDAHVADRLARCGRRAGGARRDPAPRLGEDRRGGARDRARRRGHRRSAGRDGGLRAAPREHGRRGRDARAVVRRARGADRGGRRGSARRHLPGLVPPARLRATRCGRPTGSTRSLDALDAAVGPERLGSLHLNDVRRRWLEPRPPRERRGRRARPSTGCAGRSCPSRASMRCRACSRPRAPTAAARPRRSWSCASGCAPSAGSRPAGAEPQTATGARRARRRRLLRCRLGGRRAGARARGQDARPSSARSVGRGPRPGAQSPRRRRRRAPSSSSTDEAHVGRARVVLADLLEAVDHLRREVLRPHRGQVERLGCRGLLAGGGLRSSCARSRSPPRARSAAPPPRSSRCCRLPCGRRGP